MISHIRVAAATASILALVASVSLQAQDFIDADDLMEIDDLLDDETSNETIADPFEDINRAIFGFNNAVYKNVFQPFTRQYVRIVPKEPRKGLSNFFDNLGYPIRLTGNVLQFKFGRASQETGRFLVNTTAGLAGFMDAAKEFENLNPPKEDIGQALGVWGVKHGFYIVLPFAGPTSLRDFVGRLGGRVVDPIPEPWSQLDESEDRLDLQIVDTVNDLPEIIDLYNSITDSAIDPYIAVRDGYTQLRAGKVKE